MSEQAREVIDLLDDSDGGGDDGDNDEVIVVRTVHNKSTAPAATRTAGQVKRHRDEENDSSSLRVLDRSDTKRSRKGLLKNDDDDDDTSGDTSAAENVSSVNVNGAPDASQIVRIDDDGVDNAVVIPGVLGPMNKWINSGKTSDIVQLICQKDKWSCGFRNLQMILSAVLPHLPADHAFFQKFPRRQDHVCIPSLRQIQRAFEEAWMVGFDPRGAEHFRQKLVGKPSWIGAVEVSSVLSFWGIDSAVVQFVRCRESRDQLPRFIRAYFSKCLGREACPFRTCCRSPEQSGATSSMAGGVRPTQCAKQLLQFSAICSDGFQMEEECKCPLLPLYLQWQGHSVTIVGMEEQDTLLVFDPLKKQAPSRLPVEKLITKDTQVIMVTSFRSLSLEEQQMRKGADESRFVATAAEDAVRRTMT